MYEPNRWNEDDWKEMTINHLTYELSQFVATALDLHHHEVRVESDHSVWISIAPSLDGRILGPIQYAHRRRVMVWYEIHVAGRIPV